MKKILLTLLLLLVVATGALFVLNGKDTYDADKYAASASNGLKKGSKISFTLPDQFNKSHTLNNDTQKLILVFAKATGHTVKEFLKEQPADYLQKNHALFIADISPMPVIIRNTFALPDLKKQHYSVLLIYDKKISEDFRKGTDTEKIAVVTLDKGTVAKVEYADSDDELEEKLR
jgi:uncharacterized protein YxeA